MNRAPPGPGDAGGHGETPATRLWETLSAATGDAVEPSALCAEG
jgi:hypothetical protein